MKTCYAPMSIKKMFMAQYSDTNSANNSSKQKRKINGSFIMTSRNKGKKCGRSMRKLVIFNRILKKQKGYINL